MNFALGARLLSVSATILVAAWLPQASAQAVIAGRVISLGKPGTVEIRRSDGTKYPAGKGAILRNGDTLIVAAGSFACLETAEFPAGKCYNQGSAQITARKSAAHRPGMIQILTGWLTKPGATLPSVMRARSDDEDSQVQSGPHPLLPAAGGLQFLPPTYGRASPIWRGAIRSVALQPAGAKAVPLQQHGDEWLLPASSQLPSTLQVVGASGTPVGFWQLRVSDAPPRPPGLDIAEDAMTEVDRVDRAAWIIKSGPAEWRLFAFSELQRYAAEGSYEATLLMAYALSDDCSVTPRGRNCPF